MENWQALLTVSIIILLVIVARTRKKKKNNNISENLNKAGFEISKRVNDFTNRNSILLDEKNGKFAYVNNKKGFFHIYNFAQLVEYEVVEDGDSIIKGRVGSVIAGGMMMGGLGALAGASRSKKVKSTCNSMYLRIIVDDIKNSQITIPFITTQTKKSSTFYKSIQSCAQEFTSMLAIIKSRSEEEKHINVKESASSISAADEIKKYKELFEGGIITQEEFDAKKKQLLNLA
jgi:hypothetical protein